jgi:hypothetical protein
MLNMLVNDIRLMLMHIDLQSAPLLDILLKYVSKLIAIAFLN